jgi:phosphoenolpyruvate carboxylase
MRARVMQLWQTRLLRFTKLTVADEIENALSYYESTFLREIPKLYADLERALGQHPVHSFLRMGQWIGGDRDGNPNVMRQTLDIRAAPPGRSGAAPLPDRGALPGRRTLVSAMLVDCLPAMQALAERSPDTNAHRMDEPYRRALTGVYARLAATLKELTGGEAARHAVAPQNPYRLAQEFSADLRTIEGLLARQPRHGADRAAPAPADARGRSVWLSSGHGGPAPKLGQTRRSRGRTAGKWRASNPATAQLG